MKGSEKMRTVIEKRGKKKIIAILCFFTMMFSAFAFFITGGSAEAETEYYFVMEKGASVRLDEHTGLRFVAKVDENTAKNAVFGGVIIPYEYIGKYSLDLEGDIIKQLTQQSVEVCYKENLDVSLVPNQKDGYYRVAYSITDIKNKNLNRQFIGLIYMIDDDIRRYAEFDNESDITRTFSQVVNAAYAEESLYGGTLLAEEKAIIESFIVKSDYASVNSDTITNETDLDAATNRTTITDLQNGVELTSAAVAELDTESPQIYAFTFGGDGYHEGVHVRYISENEKVAAVSADGIVTAVAKGETIVKAVIFGKIIPIKIYVLTGKTVYEITEPFVRNTGAGDSTTGTATISVETYETYGVTMKIVYDRQSANEIDNIYYLMNTDFSGVYIPENACGIRFWVYNGNTRAINFCVNNGSTQGTWYAINYKELVPGLWTEIVMSTQDFLTTTRFGFRQIGYGAQNSEYRISSFVYVTAEEMAQPVIDLIAALPSVSEVTAKDMSQIAAARNAYNGLLDSAKSSVWNIAELEALETECSEKFGVLNDMSDLTGIAVGAWSPNNIKLGVGKDAVYGNYISMQWTNAVAAEQQGIFNYDPTAWDVSFDGFDSVVFYVYNGGTSERYFVVGAGADPTQWYEVAVAAGQWTEVEVPTNVFCASNRWGVRFANDNGDCEYKISAVYGKRSAVNQTK